jgi:tellurite resistance protein TehA-like permease
VIQKKRNATAKFKAVRIYSGLPLLFAGIVFAGTSYLLHWHSAYIWLGVLAAIIGLAIIASVEVWLDTIVSLFNG